MPTSARAQAPSVISDAFARVSGFEWPSPGGEPAWHAFRLPGVRIADGTMAAVRERTLLLGPFAVLLHLSAGAVPTDASRTTVLIVTPMSGHFATLLHDLVTALLPRHDVCVLEWINARHIPASAGGFGLAGSIRSVLDALRICGPDTHLVGICQSAVPAIVAAVAANDDATIKPASLVLLGGPVDPAAHPSSVSIVLEMTPLSLLSSNALRLVEAGFEGAGRRVFPAEIQQASLMRYLMRQVMAGSRLAHRIAADDGSDTANFPFLDLYARVKDVPAEAFLDSIDTVYHRRLLWSGGLTVDGVRFVPGRVADLPLMTVEAPEDDISPPGQTRAAHALFDALPDDLRQAVTLRRGDHFSLFHGATCRDEVVPAIEQFWTRIGSRGRARHRRDWLQN